MSQKKQPTVPTIHDLLSGVQVADVGGKRVRKNSPEVTEGMRPSPFPLNEGYHVATPSQLLSLRVDVQKFEGSQLRGYQRHLSIPRVRAIARAMEADEPFQPIHVSIYRGEGRITDGQHRAAAAVISKKPLAVVIEKRSAEEQKKLFANQRKNVRPDVNVLVLSADDPYSEYVQDAVTSNTNPWSSMVTHLKSSNTRINPNQMFQIIVGYVGDTLANQGGNVINQTTLPRWNEAVAAEAASLIQVFGNKQTNPAAFTPVALRAITTAMVLAIRRHDRDPELIERWGRVMPQFDFTKYPHIRSSAQLADELIRHWNKRLTQARKAVRD